jgi:hypothetical protein
MGDNQSIDPYPLPPWLGRFLQNPPALQGGISLYIEDRGERPLQLELRAAGAEAHLQAVPLPQPYPSALRRLLASRQDFDAVVVPHIPQGLPDAAKELQISFLDVQGYGQVVQPGFFYFALPSHRAAPHQLRRSPFAPKGSRIVRALLNEPHRAWKLSELASEVDFDPGNAHKILGALIEDGLVRRLRDDYVLEEPGVLLEAWADRNRPPLNQVRLPVADDLNSAVRRLINLIEGSAAISGELAAELLISYLSAASAIVHVFSPHDLELVESWERAQIPSPIARQFLSVRLGDEGIRQFGQLIEGLPVVSAPQLYVDLSRSRGRGREAAEELRKRVLKY